jgi:mono/diheme cytochrome c family protein
MRKLVIIAVAVAAVGGLGAIILGGGASTGNSATSRGQYLATIMDCTGCHTPGTLLGKPDHARPLAGSEVGFQIPGLGIFYPPNLTPDRESGLGEWTTDQIVKAVRTGERPDGRILVPVMPYHSYAALTDEDAKDLASYLKTLRPVRNKVPGPIGETETSPAPYLTVVAPK